MPLARALCCLALVSACGTSAEPSRVRAPASPVAAPSGTSSASSASSRPAGAAPQRARVILFVWDGLRPDSVNATDTPHLAALAEEGTVFTEHHATFPSFTMVNAATLASGGLADTTGFASNWVWQPGALKRTPRGEAVLGPGGEPLRYEQPFFTEDFTALRDLDEHFGGQLLRSGTLFEAARRSGLKTVAIGKSGPAFLQDRHREGVVWDEKAAWPLALVKALQARGVRVPRGAADAHPAGAVTLAPDNDDPTDNPPSKKLPDGKTPDPTGAVDVPAHGSTAYLLDVYLQHLLPDEDPDLTVLWSRNPDTAQHWYGPGSDVARRALREVDAQLGALLETLGRLGRRESTTVMVVSDHGHSSVSGPLDSFPLRELRATPSGTEVGAPDPGGYSVSGDVRLADLLTRVGRFHAFDGVGCLFDPVLSGIRADGERLYPVRTDDARGTVCGLDPKTGKGGARYTTPAYRVPTPLPRDAVVIALNGGTDALYVPSHDPALVRRVTRFLQGRPEIGVIFQNGRYPLMPGALPMASVRVDSGDERRDADLLVSYAYDEDAVVHGHRGIVYEGAQNLRGMHGSFSPIDVHNTLIASGPRFRRAFRDPLPTGNMDVAPTIATLLGLALPRADGRVLEEALTVPDVPLTAFTVQAPAPIESTEATGLTVFLPTDTAGTRIDRSRTTYRATVWARTVTRSGRTFTYFDRARAVRR